MHTTLLKLILALSLITPVCTFASEGFDDLVRVLRAQDEATLSYVRNSRMQYEFTVEEIQYLYDEMGASPRIIEEALNAGLRQRTYEEGPREIRVIVAPPPDETNMALFFDALEPYGQWIEVDNRWVWRPQVAIYNPNWRPYFDGGRWVYTDAGWAWSSNYSWGWAAFHYGRWNSNPIFGWVWTPDSVWGPAWVSWRSGESHYGWAPLPSSARFDRDLGFGRDNENLDFGLTERDYRFVPVEKILEPALHTQSVPQTTVTNVYNNTTVVQNNIIYNDNRVVNRGPSIERVRRSSGREIREVHITDAQVRTGEAIPRNKLNQDNFEVYRPTMKNTAPVTREVVEARQLALAQKRGQLQAQKAEKFDSNATRAAELRHADFDAKQKMLNALADARKMKKEESAEVTAARIKARELEALQKQQELKREVETRQQEEAKKEAAIAAEKRARQAAQEKAEAVRKEALADQQTENAAERARALEREQLARAAAAEEQARIAAREKEAASRNELIQKQQAEAAAERQAKAKARQEEGAKNRALAVAETQARLAAQEKAEAVRKEALIARQSETAAEKARALEREQALAKVSALEEQSRIAAREKEAAARKELLQKQLSDAAAERQAKAKARQEEDAKEKAQIAAEVQARLAAQEKAEAARKEALIAKQTETAAERARVQQQEEARKQALVVEQQAKLAAQDKEAAARKEALDTKRGEVAAEQQAKAKARQDEEAKNRAEAVEEAQARAAAREKAKEAEGQKREDRRDAAVQKRDEGRETAAEHFVDSGTLLPKPAGVKPEVVAAITVKQRGVDKTYYLVATGPIAVQIDALVQKGAKVRLKGKLIEDSITVENVDEIGGRSKGDK